MMKKLISSIAVLAALTCFGQGIRTVPAGSQVSVTPSASTLFVIVTNVTQVVSNETHIAAGDNIRVETNGSLHTISASTNLVTDAELLGSTNLLGSAAYAEVSDFLSVGLAASPVIQTNLAQIKTYESFPVMASLDDGSVMYVTYRSADDHLFTTNSVIRWSRTVDFGQTWTNTSTIVNNHPEEVRNHAFGILPDGRQLLAYGCFINATNTPSGSRLRWSDDNGVTWSSEMDLPTNGTSGYVNFSGQIKYKDGRIYMGGYDILKTNYFFYSDDRGTNWSRVAISPTNNWNETTVQPITRNVALAFSRPFTGSDIGVFGTTNGGLNWSFLGMAGLPVTDGAGNLPSMNLVFADNGPMVVLSFGFRPYNRIVMSSVLANEIFRDPGVIGKSLVITEHRIYDTAAANVTDGGYVSSISRSPNSGQFLSAYYVGTGPGLQGTNAQIRFALVPPRTMINSDMQAVSSASLTNMANEFRLWPSYLTGANYNGGFWFGAVGSYTMGYSCSNDVLAAGGQFWLEPVIPSGGSTNSRGFRVINSSTRHPYFSVGDDGRAEVATNLYVGNSIIMATNYNPLNFVPISGKVRLSSSNNWMFSVSEVYTNPVFQIAP